MGSLIERLYEKCNKRKEYIYNWCILILILMFLLGSFYILETSQTFQHNKVYMYFIHKRLLYVLIVVVSLRCRFKYSLLITTMISLVEIFDIFYFERSGLMIYSVIISLPIYYFISIMVGLLKIKNARLNEANNQLKHNYQQTIDVMIKVLEAKDSYTKGHSERVANLTSLLVNKLYISDQGAEDICTAARLHDVGKVGVGDIILNKPGKLTDEEYAVIKNHPMIGAEILEQIKELDGIVPIIYHHHERYDGKGYPEGLKGEEIPLGSRIIAVVDSFDAMISKRAYREPLSISKAVNELIENIDKQFEGKIVYAFLEVLNDIGLEYEAKLY